MDQIFWMNLADGSIGATIKDARQVFFNNIFDLCFICKYNESTE